MGNQGKVIKWSPKTIMEVIAEFGSTFWASCPLSLGPTFYWNQPWGGRFAGFPGRQTFAFACPVLGPLSGCREEDVAVGVPKERKTLWASQTWEPTVSSLTVSHDGTCHCQRRVSNSMDTEGQTELTSLQTWVMLTYYSLKNYVIFLCVGKKNMIWRRISSTQEFQWNTDKNMLHFRFFLGWFWFIFSLWGWQLGLYI